MPVNFFIKSSVPQQQATSVPPTQLVSFVIGYPFIYTLVAANLTVWLDGVLAISAGVFQAGYTGTIIDLLVGVISVVFTTSPSFVKNKVVDCVSKLTGLPSDQWVSFSFEVGLGEIASLAAQSWCAGNRVDLSWVNPSGVTQLKLLRSKQGYVSSDTDPSAVTLYTGAPITAFVDGVYSGGITTSNTGLLDGTFYYYTVFLAFNPSAYVYYTSNSAQVTGLSIRNYADKEGTYVYNKFFPVWERRADQDPTRGVNQGVLAMIADTLQCGINLIRGYADGLLKIRDPDEMPAGQIGISNNSKGIMLAQCWDLGFPVQPEFNLPALRRVVSDLTGKVLKQKGTCPSLVNLVSILAGWTPRCDEIISPVCGVDRIFRSWAQPSQIFMASGVITNSTGSVAFDPSNFFLADGVTTAGFPDPAEYIGMFLLDSMGTFACIKSWDGAHTYTYDNASATLRGNITGSGSGGLKTFQIQSVDTGRYPWQFPSPASAPTWGQNAWAGYILRDHTSAAFTVVSSVATTGVGATTLTLASGTPASGTFSLSLTGSVTVMYNVTLYAGRFSLTYDPQADVRLAQENAEGPWSFTAAPQASIQQLGYGASLSDVILWVNGQASLVGTVTGVTNSTLTDSTASWTTDQWRNFWVNPNQGATGMYRVIHNTSTTLVLDTEQVDLTAYTGVNASYAIVTELVKDLFLGISRILPEYSPYQSNTVIRFE